MVEQKFLMDPFNLYVKLSFILSLAIVTTAQPTYLYHICPNTTTFAINSTYQTNIVSVLTSLSKNIYLQDGFSRDSTGYPPDEVFGLSLCTAGLSIDICQNCVSNATKSIVQRCPEERSAIVWYAECLLQYSSQNIFSSMMVSPLVYMWNTQNITDQESFNEILEKTMSETITEASSNKKGAQKFAAKEANFTAFQTVYTFAQCTPDLSAPNCNRCLQTAVSQLPACCAGKEGGRILMPSCSVRFQMYRFYDVTGYQPEVYPYYNTTVIGELPTSTPSPPPSTQRLHHYQKKGKGTELVGL